MLTLYCVPLQLFPHKFLLCKWISLEALMGKNVLRFFFSFLKPIITIPTSPPFIFITESTVISFDSCLKVSRTLLTRALQGWRGDTGVLPYSSHVCSALGMSHTDLHSWERFISVIFHCSSLPSWLTLGDVH